MPCWVAPHDVPPGGDYNHAIMTSIAACSAMVLVYSRHSVSSDPVAREVERALHRKVPVIPVRLEQAPPSLAMEYMISTAQWVDAFPPPLERHLEAIVAAVKPRPQARPRHAEGRPPRRRPTPTPRSTRLSRARRSSARSP